MEINNTAYSAQEMALLVTNERSEAQTERVGASFVDQTDRFEPSQAVLGAADALPGQATSKFEVTGDFGFCQNCGTGHGASAAKEGNNQTSEVNGTEIPDLHALLGSEEAKADTETADESEEEVVPETERDALTGDVELTEEEKKQVEELKRRDQEVRTHEHAHVAAGGQYVRGGISYEYQTGADGKRYAVGGEVSIDTSPESDPQDTIRKAQTIRQAALAPAEPSGQDRRAAAAAAQMELKARQEIAKEKLEGEGDGGEDVLSDVDDVLGTNQSEESDNTHDRAPDLPNGQVAQGEKRSVEDHGDAGLPEADALPVPDVSGDGGIVQTGEMAPSDITPPEKEDAGLPEVSAPPVSQPVTQLDYGEKVRAGGLVDVYG